MRERQPEATGPRAPRVPRTVARTIVVVLIVTALYVAVGRQQIAVLGLSVYPDPTLAFSLRQSEAPSGSVLQLDGAPAGAWLEFSADGVRAYAPTFADRSSVAAVVPPVFRGNTVGSGDVEIRLLSPRGPIWTSSMGTPFTVDAPNVTATRLGNPTLFALQVIHGLLTNAADAASTADAARAPAEMKEYASALTTLRLEAEALSKQFEIVAWGNSERVTLPGITLDRDGIRLMDELAVQYFTTMAVAGSSLCGDVKAQATAGLAAKDSEEALAAAASFARSIVNCDAGDVREIAARTKAWLVTLAYTTTEAHRTASDLPIAAALQIAVVSWSDEALSATYLWKQYERTEALRSFMLDRATANVLHDSLRKVAEGEPYLSQQIEAVRGRWSSDHRLLASILDQGEASQERVASALAERVPVLATPSPIPAPSIPVWQGLRLCGTLIEHRSPSASQAGSITIEGEKFSIATDVRESIWSGAHAGTKVCMSGTFAESQTGRTLIFELRLGPYSPP